MTIYSAIANGFGFDDTLWYPDDSPAWITCGNEYSGGSRIANAYILFGTITIQAGQKIDSAILRAYQNYHESTNGSPVIEVSVEKSADPAAPASFTDMMARSQSTIRIGITGTGVDNAFNLFDLKEMIQELYNIYDFSDGANIQVFLRDNGSPNYARRRFLKYQYSGGLYAPTLEIITSPSGELPPPTTQGEVDFTSVPTGSSVFINDELTPAGITPFEIVLEQGDYYYVATHEGYYDLPVTGFHVTADVVNPVSFSLTQIPPPVGELPLFKFVQLNDLKIATSEQLDKVAQAAAEINQINPNFVIFNGDLVQNQALLASFAMSLSNFTAPTHCAIGELEDKTLFESNLGTRNYSFDIEGYHCIVIDSTKPSGLTYGGGFEPSTLTWLSNHLASVGSSVPIMIFCHHSFWSPWMWNPRENLFMDVENPDEIFDILAGYNIVGVFSGHADLRWQYEHPTTGWQFVIGASMNCSGVANFDYSLPGYTVVEVYSTRIKTYYVPLGKVYDYYIGPKTNVITVGQGDGDFNGTNNDAVQDAIDYAKNTYGAATVLVKESLLEYWLGYTDNRNPTLTGEYQCPVRVRPNIWLYGESRSGVLFKFTPGSINKKGVSNAWIPGVNNVRLGNFTVDGNKDNCPDGEFTAHVWFSGIEITGPAGSATTLPQADANYVHDIIVEDVEVKNMWHMGISFYGVRRPSARNNFIDNIGQALNPDHPTDFFQCEGNKITNCGNVCEAADIENSLIYRNEVDTVTQFIEFFSYLTGSTMRNNAILWNKIKNVSGVQPYTINVKLNIGFIEIGHQTYENVANTEAVHYGASNKNWSIHDNIYINTNILHDRYDSGSQISTPDDIEVLEVTPTSVTVRVLGGYVLGPYPYTGTARAQFWFEAKEYRSGNEVLVESPAWDGDTAVFTINPAYSYTFRVRAGNTPITAWTKWVAAAISGPAPPEVSYLTIYSDPPGKNIIIDGIDQGPTPIERLEVDSGPHIWEVNEIGFRPMSGSIVTEPFMETPLNVSLTWIMDPPASRGIQKYTWEYFHTLIRNPSESDNFFRVCQEIGVTSALMSYYSSTLTGENIATDPANVAAFILRAKSLGIEVQGLPYVYLYNPADRTINDLVSPDLYVKPQIEALLEYNRLYPNARFSSVNLDVEGAGGNLTVISQYLNFLKTIKTYTNSAGETLVTQGLKLTASIPAPYYFAGGGASSPPDPTALAEAIKVYKELQEVQIVGYETNLTDMQTHMADAPAVCEANSIVFYPGYECWQYTPIYGTLGTPVPPYGKEYYKQLAKDVDNDLADFTYCGGHYLHAYAAAANWWMIKEVVWPSMPTINTPASFMLGITVKRADFYSPFPYIFGVKANFTNGTSSVTSSRLVCLQSSLTDSEKTVYLEMILPETLPSDTYRLYVDTYYMDMKGPAPNRDSLLYPALGSDIDMIELLSMDDLKSITVTGKLEPPLLLDTKDGPVFQLNSPLPTGTLIVTTNPPGATVVIDDMEIGATSAGGLSIPLTLGDHTYVLSLSGYKTTEGTISIVNGDNFLDEILKKEPSNNLVLAGGALAGGALILMAIISQRRRKI